MVLPSRDTPILILITVSANIGHTFNIDISVKSIRLALVTFALISVILVNW